MVVSERDWLGGAIEAAKGRGDSVDKCIGAGVVFDDSVRAPATFLIAELGVNACPHRVFRDAIAGHCTVEDNVIVGGLSGIHQFVRIGKGAIIGALTMVTNDVIPYGLVQGPRGQLDGLNLVGLKRSGVSREDITALRAAFQMLAQGEGSFLERSKRLGDETDSAYVQTIVDFVLGDSERSFLTPG